MNKTKKAMIISAVGLGLIYLVLISAAKNGYGYMGYGGYQRGPSFLYFGGPSLFRNPSLRSGSPGVRSTRGGGPGSGK